MSVITHRGEQVFVPDFAGKFPFRVEGQKAMLPWQRAAITAGLATQDGPPEALRFQCRIATDAHEAFKLVKVDDGTTLTRHHRSAPQFGRNRHGLAYLTVTLVHSKDGEAYTFRWEGDAVPLDMQKVAVAHDEGRAVRTKVITLDLAKARVVPAWVANGHAGPSSETRSHEVEKKRKGKSGIRRAKRFCARLTAEDLATA